MAKFKHRLVGAEKIRTLTDFDEAVRARLRLVFESSGRSVLQGAQEEASSKLHVRKGRLLRSIKMQPYESEYGFGVKVFSNWYIARFWERGFGHGKSFSVKAHVRHVKTRDKQSVVALRSGKTRTRIAFKQSASGITFVKAFDRKINQTARPFLKPSLDARRMQIRAAIAQAAKGK